jgi:hypothetical protein
MNQPAARWFLAGLIFDPEDGINTFHRNVGPHIDYRALYPRRGQHSASLILEQRDENDQKIPQVNILCSNEDQPHVMNSCFRKSGLYSQKDDRWHGSLRKQTLFNVNVEVQRWTWNSLYRHQRRRGEAQDPLFERWYTVHIFSVLWRGEWMFLTFRLLRIRRKVMVLLEVFRCVSCWNYPGRHEWVTK